LPEDVFREPALENCHSACYQFNNLADQRGMPEMSAPSPALRALAEITFAAGAIIMRHYWSATVETRRKDDASPVTAADEEAESFILKRLRAFAPDIPIIAEEEAAAGRIAVVGARFFLVDPLDGTKEFINRNGEFTVNIAEIENGKPVRGVVYAPAIARLFMGEMGQGAWEIKGEALDWNAARTIAARKPASDGWVAVASRSHRDAKTDEYLAAYKIKDFAAAGSSLKFCLVAAGEADIYPRTGRTMEWDTAAGHAVLAAAGGSVTTLDEKPFLYGKAEEKFANPFFVAKGAA
jgi:3'(2'), 5'-bisphosphate nucleotidase